MAIAKPQVLVFQEFRISPAEITEPLRAHISGPNGGLHRYTDSDEKPLINVGAYDRNNQVCYPWPQRAPARWWTTTTRAFSWTQPYCCTTKT